MEEDTVMPPRLHAPSSSTIKIFLLCEDDACIRTLTGLWQPSEVTWATFATDTALLETLFIDPPDLLITVLEGTNINGQELANTIKNENVYRQVRIVMLLDADTLRKGIDWTLLPADDFLLMPQDPAVIRARLELVLYRSTLSLDANPLTRLPGNGSIIQAVEQYSLSRLDFAMAHADIDHFKSFNDRYGFARGDEALRMTARIIAATVKNLGVAPSFVGHIGGDDFVFILPPEHVRAACEEIIAAYDAIIPSFYDEKDRHCGYIESVDRQGQVQRFPFLSISIAVVISKGEQPRPFGQLSHIAGQVKHVVKAQPGSAYMVDRRNYT